MTTIDEQIAHQQRIVKDCLNNPKLHSAVLRNAKAILASLEELKRIQSAEIGGNTLDNDNELLREARELLNEDWCGTSADSIGSKLISRINAHLASAEAHPPAPNSLVVPVEPTDAQWQAGSLTLKGHNDTPYMDSPTRKAVAIAVYNAMLRAAKEPT